MSKLKYNFVDIRYIIIAFVKWRSPVGLRHVVLKTFINILVTFINIIQVDADNVSDHFKMRQKKLVKERLEITMWSYSFLFF